jgi:Coenzyme PQQ synthesis protein D (PqqD)
MKAAQHVRANVTTDGVVLLDVKEGSVYSANVVGARIWELLQSGRTQAEIVEQIAVEYSAPHATVETDLREFVHALRNRALVTEPR